MVGTAVYQVGLLSSIHANARSALNPGAHHTDPPAATEDSTAAIKPWIWKSGIMFRQRSCGVSANVAPILLADAVTFSWESGTIFGRDVVPEVCSTSAISAGAANPPDAGDANSVALSAKRLKLPTGPFSSGMRRRMGTLAAWAASIAGVSSPACTISALAERSAK